MYKSFKVGRIRFALNSFPKTSKGVSPVYISGIRKWDAFIDKNYSLVIGCYRVIISIDKPMVGCCCDTPTRETKHKGK